VGIAVAIVLELLILWMLLGLGIYGGTGTPDAVSVTTFDASEASEPDTPEAESEEEAEQTEAAVPEQEAPQETQAAPLIQPPSALPRPSPIVIPPAPPAPPQPEATPDAPATPRARAVIRQGSAIGPPNTGRRGGPDSEVVGTAPDGSPLYAATWFREPYPQELSGYLSGARGPGWGLIACRTVADWKVQDCVILGESPAGSNIANAAEAAAWQFLVRPPRVGGEYQVGAWVRIRITYGNGQGPPR